ncbi:undecaprenyl-diphosphate phosphatase [Agrobacterium sp. SHOUNA12C]|uniref:Undecaprenyl-diphosphatase n=2 Tax=Rhizobium rhizogenes TaxID=359 RepID=B9J7M5_RHIR8|nr:MULTISPECIES: undecaprenyl-diphosphate phosphatase [Rhizobium]ACM25197.1 undecaprenol kinase [Rhizobium rhizogenes K84]KAA6487058.1 undecaprenyl-diphosphate phosphatase [Agrobacterium sp. ICMP 7243]MCJ9725135.1 undecaprenyl-diphosphate phosphatase [Agrobacterium sp. BETTINA12B]MCJ9761101.1 undecaprenyl-diphosphate phosphatase [Agrobacterium sp. SHOUNA12C]OCI97827.1 undecaprenyl-diphosphatase [Agrobacterium sp. 13-626]OCJ21551.1 undecaprenyl-diphosphatase [Agrobacterium sp. B131/95]OCJ2700
MAEQIIIALVLGLVEGLTEFIPVSSTGHLILIGHFLGFKSAGTFEVLIQLGAILAILLVYFNRLVQIAKALPVSVKARHFVLAVLFGFLPAAIIGALAHDFIKGVLFETPILICISLILGGIVLLVIDRIEFKPKYTSAYDFSWPMAIKIGFFQCLAMIPGTSRSGSTIVGALLLGADKRSAAEFSFFLAMPTMVGAFTLDLWKSRNDLSFADGQLIVIGFVAAFITALFVVRALLDFVSRRGYAPFAWWRIGVGILGLIGLYTVG